MSFLNNQSKPFSFSSSTTTNTWDASKQNNTSQFNSPFTAQSNSTFNSQFNNSTQTDIINIMNESKNIQLQILNEIKKHNTPITPSSSTVHKEIKCDGCMKVNITGIRYKCLICKNYDYCEECEQKLPHNPYHIFIKIKDTEMFNTLIQQNVQIFSAE